MPTDITPRETTAGAGLIALAERLTDAQTVPPVLRAHVLPSEGLKRGNFNSFIENKGNFNSFIDKKGNFNSFIEPTV
ncbi:hypothetical protein [Nocardia wallacei]|uniref:hypothetical protein n=1 Tax=Nocardia wallacei TaxID=480035 RepID=UPI00245884E9|nr:hypothetical protein [Nocardia wallacei]